MLKKDNIILGALIGLVLPAIMYGILTLLAGVTGTGTVWTKPLEADNMIILSLAVNIIPIRIYFVNWKMDKTGRGVLFITFILVVLFFIFIRYF